MKYINFFVLVLIFSTLTACGGGDGDGYGGPGTGNPPEEDVPQGEGTTPPADITVGSIVITHPNEAIVDNLDGTYSFHYAVLINDQDGTPAPNGVRVDLQVVDTVIAQGTLTDIDTNNTASGTTLSVLDVVRPNDTPNDWSNNPAADLTTASVTRPGILGGSNRRILANDLVIMTGSLEEAPPVLGPGGILGQVDSRDVSRTVANTPSLSNQLTVSEAYLSSYPAYGETANTNYYIAASMLSAGVTGEDTEGTPTQGHTVTKDGKGVATIWVTYAADLEHVRAGCAPAEIDERVSPMGSSQPMLIATTNGISNVRRICFSAIGPYRLAGFPEKLVNGGSVTVCVNDAGNGNGVRVPYARVSVSQSSGDALGSVTYDTDTPTVNGLPYTNQYGCFTFNAGIVGNPGDTAVLTAYAGTSSVDITLSIPN